MVFADGSELLIRPVTKVIEGVINAIKEDLLPLFKQTAEQIANLAEGNTQAKEILRNLPTHIAAAQLDEAVGEPNKEIGFRFSDTFTENGTQTMQNMLIKTKIDITEFGAFVASNYRSRTQF